MDLNQALELITTKLSTWIRDFIEILPNLAIASVLLVLGIFLAKKIRTLAHNMFDKIVSAKTLVSLFSSIVYVFLISIIVFTALSIVKLDKVVVSLLAGAGIVGLALAFAFQDIAANFMSGIFISLRRPIRIGDFVKLGGYTGTVTEINLRDTIIKTGQGQIVIIPNKEIFQNPIENFSMLGKRRMDLQVGISYGDDLEKVVEVTLDALKGIKGTTDDEITLFFQEFGGSSINYTVRIWVDNPRQSSYSEVAHEAIKRIKKAYEVNNISLPFPTRTLDFGVKGGKTLGEVLESAKLNRQ
ncbi:MAG: mechanosensitive ion channel family protein [Bacteroidetes bacterium]|nr:MAG: mechanosensitive ion channel family protein [Bacteroidota bacterium]REK07548.1 MAG: mechanosensitive ion channel family protein [Bacteroidota bacterium]REK37019.1 MAG: mechanosensitive ion channel family protein [Bacteroidota bacterium]REK47840.1 MAG: mechanosensitive ion channel family protein [Bacteroidota bacterium]